MKLLKLSLVLLLLIVITVPVFGFENVDAIWELEPMWTISDESESHFSFLARQTYRFWDFGLQAVADIDFEPDFSDIASIYVEHKLFYTYEFVTIYIKTFHTKLPEHSIADWNFPTKSYSIGFDLRLVML